MIKDAQTQESVASMLKNLGSPDVLLDLVEDDPGQFWRWVSGEQSINQSVSQTLCNIVYLKYDLVLILGK